MMTEQLSVDKEMDAALEESIRHWKRLAANPFCDGHGIHLCALCQLIIARRHGLLSCDLCVVMASTGKRGCIGTPYTAYAAAMARGQYSKARQAAAEEVAFLESLRRTEA
jgi:hypothetical protein